MKTLGHAYAHACSSSMNACFMHTYTYTGMHTHAMVLETTKDKFSTLKFGFGTNPTLSRAALNPHFQTIKCHTWYLFRRHRKS